MALHTLADLGGWTLEDKDQDIRGRPLLTAEGRQVGVIKDLAVDLERERVWAVVTDQGEAYAVEGLEIGPDAVTAHDGPISGGTSGPEPMRARPGRTYDVRVIRPTSA